jgi:membrane protease YdiL (CAAX protease family)
MRLENRPFGAYGLPRQSAFGPLLLKGALWGLVAISVLVLIMRGMGVFYFGRVALQGPRLLKFAVFWAVLFLVGAAFEEFLFRGYSQFTLAQSLGFWPAAILLSALFGWVHLGNQGEAWMGALGAASIGLFWCLTLRRTGSLWFAFGMHAAWNWGETFIYSVPNSGMRAPGHLFRSSLRGSVWLTGGSVGPEGSVLVFILIVLMWIAFDRLYPTRSASLEPGSPLS